MSYATYQWPGYGQLWHKSPTGGSRTTAFTLGGEIWIEHVVGWLQGKSLRVSPRSCLWCRVEGGDSLLLLKQLSSTRFTRNWRSVQLHDIHTRGCTAHLSRFESVIFSCLTQKYTEIQWKQTRHKMIQMSYLCASVVPVASWFEIFRVLQVIWITELTGHFVVNAGTSIIGDTISG